MTFTIPLQTLRDRLNNAEIKQLDLAGNFESKWIAARVVDLRGNELRLISSTGEDPDTFRMAKPGEVDEFFGKKPAKANSNITAGQSEATKQALNPATYMRLFQVLIDAAVAGDRCPVLQELVGKHKIPGGYSVNALVDLGWIRSEIYPQNWRVVEIMVGEHKGARTKEKPGGHKPYETYFNPEIQE